MLAKKGHNQRHLQRRPFDQARQQAQVEQVDRAEQILRQVHLRDRQTRGHGQDRGDSDRHQRRRYAGDRARSQRLPQHQQQNRQRSNHRRAVRTVPIHDRVPDRRRHLQQILERGPAHRIVQHDVKLRGEDDHREAGHQAMNDRWRHRSENLSQPTAPGHELQHARRQHDVPVHFAVEREHDDPLARLGADFGMHALDLPAQTVLNDLRQLWPAAVEQLLPHLLDQIASPLAFLFPPPTKSQRESGLL